MARKRSAKVKPVKTGHKPGVPKLQLPPEPEVPRAPMSDEAAWNAYAQACVARSRAVVTLVEEHSRRRLAAAEQLEPLDYRTTHGALSDDRNAVVERFGRQIPDVEGRPGHPHKVYDTLATLFRNGSIDDDELAAGRTFEEDFRFAAIDPLHASNPARIPGTTAGDMTHGMVAGREKVYRAMAALGGYSSPAGSAVWWVLGCGKTIKEFAQSTQFGGGRSLDERAAKGLFIGALGVLAVRYGLKRS